MSLYERVLLYVAVGLSAGTLFAVLVLWCRYRRSNLKLVQKQDQSNSFVGFLIAVAALFVIGAGVVIGLLLYNNDKVTQFEIQAQNILDMQAVTLTVAGLAVSLVSIITVIFNNIDREKKVKELAVQLKEQNEKEVAQIKDAYREQLEKLDALDVQIAKSRIQMEIMEGLLLSDEQFDIKSRRLNDLHNRYPHNNNNIIKGLMALYNNQANHVKDSKIRKELYERILFLEHSCVPQDMQENEYLSTYTIVGEAYLSIGKLEISNKELAEDYLKHAERIYKNITLKHPESSKSTIVQNMLGLTYFWLFLCSGKENVAWLQQSEGCFGRSTLYENSNYRFENNYGVTLHNLAKYYADDAGKRTEYLQHALKRHQISFDLNPQHALSVLNIADVKLTQFQYEYDFDFTKMNVEDVINAVPLQTSQQEKMEIAIQDILRFLDKAQSLNPLLANCYYKRANCYLYYVILHVAIKKRLKDGEGQQIMLCRQIQSELEEARHNLSRAEQINNKSDALIELKKLYETLSATFHKD